MVKRKYALFIVSGEGEGRRVSGAWEMTRLCKIGDERV